MSTNTILLKKFNYLKDLAFINGKWTSGINKATFPVLSPTTRQVVANVPDLSEVDIKASISCANEAFHSWQHTSCRYRSDILKKLSSQMLKNEDELATIMTLECGKPFHEAKGEVKYAASFLEWFSEEAKRINGEVLPNIEPHLRRFVLKQPVGVCGMITPWNFPLAMITRKVAPALAAGCTTVIKPSEETPLSALAFAQLVDEVQVPQGVVNVITCSRNNTELAGLLLCTSPLVRNISFTGSTKVGKWLLEKSASTVKKVSLELGGNAPFIVFDSADIKLAADRAVKARFRNAGQTCICAERILVQENVYESFIDEFKKITMALRVRDPMSSECDISSLINEQALAKVEDHVNDALLNGGKIVCGGKKLSSNGPLFYEPTIIRDCTTNMKCIAEETFGPVAPVIKFKTEEEALLLANSRNSGLSGYIFTNNTSQSWRVAERLEVGMVGVNESAITNEMVPFGGIKESGLGREGSSHGIEEYIELKLVCIGALENK
ncbi:succinate-semialdehyde dehydrogenase, mitochondrial isoform X1 [Hydra vulgaris]|uniref:succinate-semialdehyde dehydrogenase, mitochondrial isoform X1 n=1 Tax=Hydra vulgaris TaxID=6087 RepID=UPI001F5E804C|nr:succinate-semialdehyde dehydrogenase, mitochondrial-like [Hydra vulgaris]